MIYRVNRFVFSDSGRIAFLIAAIILLALTGVKLGQIAGANLLRNDGQETTTAWVDGLLKNTNDIPDILSGATPTEETKSLLKNASAFGDVYRFKLWNRSGKLILLSEGSGLYNSVEITRISAGRAFADCLRTGSPLTRSYAGGTSGNPAYFAISFVPVKQNGLVIGVFEVYLDQTGDHALYQGSLHLTESIIAFAVLLAGGVPAFLIHRKMREHRKSEAEALFLSEHDSLTNLPNRKNLGESAKAVLDATKNNNEFAAVLLIDLDRFKDINDSFGHEVGDEVLRAVAGRLSSNLRDEDLVARFGGDEFIVLQVGMAQPGGAAVLAQRLQRVLSEPYKIGALEVNSGASIGIAIAPTDAEGWDPLVARADASLYTAKAKGRNAICFFEAGMEATVRERSRIEADLRRALETQAFELAYQPVSNLQDGSLLGFEALLRWPQGWDQQSPAKFIPIAEESDLIVPIGAWVLETACKEAASWPRPLKIAVNLSPVQFRVGNIVSVVANALTASGLDPARLELEVTESLWIQNTDAVLDQLGRLRSMGVSISLDDFGTGYSSLTYLWKFPFDVVKIDQTFVSEMMFDQKAAAIVNTIVALGGTLGMTITAEGVETQMQANILRHAGCHQVQGYLFGKPLSASSANALVNELDSSHWVTNR